jgi:hypothetical protein
MFPFAGMPKVVQWLAEVLPLTHFLRLIRGVMLRGASLLELWPDVLALIAFTAVMMTAGDPALQQAPGLSEGTRAPCGNGDRSQADCSACLAIGLAANCSSPR